MATDTTRTLTGQEVVVILGGKAADIANLNTLGTFGDNAAANISSWIESVSPDINVPTAARTSLGAGANALVDDQPTGLISFGLQINWLTNSDVEANIPSLVVENRLGSFLLPIRLVYGVKSSSNRYYQCLGRLTSYSPPANSGSLVMATSSFTGNRSFGTGMTAGMTNV